MIIIIIIIIKTLAITPKKKPKKTMKGGRKTDCLGTSGLKEQHSGESSGFL